MFRYWNIHLSYWYPQALKNFSSYAAAMRRKSRNMWRSPHLASNSKFQSLWLQLAKVSVLLCEKWIHVAKSGVISYS